MDAYLLIAETVLRAERRPLSPRAILAAAYRNDCVPVHLYGKTQHKTLGARLSEDIITRRENSPFFRTKPGRFFLKDFLNDESISEEYKQPITARRRVRDLMLGPALAFSIDDLASITLTNTIIAPERILSLLQDSRYRYDNPKDQRPDSVFLWSFVAVQREWEILTYRLGRYRDDRDTFMSRRSVGFSTLVHRDQRTFFNINDFGIIDSGVNATKVDLDMPNIKSTEKIDGLTANLKNFIWVSQNDGRNDLLAVVRFECPHWFHPERRRLALNNLSWLDIRTPVNNIDDFDPWSQHVLLNGHLL